MTVVVYIDFHHTKYTRVQVVHFILMFPFSAMRLFPFCTFPILFSCEKCFVCVLFHFTHSPSLICSKRQFSSPQILHIKHDLIKQHYNEYFTLFSTWTYCILFNFSLHKILLVWLFFLHAKFLYIISYCIKRRHFIFSRWAMTRALTELRYWEHHIVMYGSHKCHQICLIFVGESGAAAAAHTHDSGCIMYMDSV